MLDCTVKDYFINQINESHRVFFWRIVILELANLIWLLKRKHNYWKLSVTLLDGLALCGAVELGKRFFPRCSEVLNKIMDADDLSQLAYLGHDTPAERLVKKQRYMELQEVLSKAFNEDKEEIGRSALSSSSSSTSIGVVTPNAKLTIKKWVSSTTLWGDAAICFCIIFIFSLLGLVFIFLVFLFLFVT